MAPIRICSVLMALLFNLGVAIVCPGGQHKCPKTIFSESTCCQVPDGSYGCCPLPNAVCCDDHIHCCSHGSVCNGGSCEKGDQDVLPANRSVLLTARVVCPDKKHVCPNDYTCCFNSQYKEYGCCPMPHAVCCSDGIHCCPHGSRCDLVHQHCIREESENDIFNKLGSFRSFSSYVSEAERVLSVICPGGEYQCPDGSTCCMLPSGKWGCCPFAKATCCSDKLHCCPNGMKCDPTSHSCHQDARNVTWSENKPSTAVPKSAYIICPGGTYKCPDNTTCCQSTGGWGCCPYADAVCCSDNKHCCPSGYQCNVASHQCIKGSRHVPWLEKLPAKP